MKVRVALQIGCTAAGDEGQELLLAANTATGLRLLCPRLRSQQVQGTRGEKGGPWKAY